MPLARFRVAKANLDSLLFQDLKSFHVMKIIDNGNNEDYFEMIVNGDFPLPFNESLYIPYITLFHETQMLRDKNGDVYHKINVEIHHNAEMTGVSAGETLIDEYEQKALRVTWLRENHNRLIDSGIITEDKLNDHVMCLQTEVRMFKNLCKG